MKSSLRSTLIFSTLALLALTACDQTGFLSEAGSSVDEGGFGQPTMINTLAMTTGDATLAVGRRFETEVNSVVTFAFNRTELSPTARATLDTQANWIRQFPEEIQ